MQTCWAADNGTTTAQQTCIYTCCGQTYCSAGASYYYKLLTTCACVPSVCENSCNSPGDYCGGGAPNVTTQACSTCLTSAFGTGAACSAATGSAIDTQCQANAQCAAYTQCANGCP